MQLSTFRYSGFQPFDDPLHFTFNVNDVFPLQSGGGTVRIKPPLSDTLGNGTKVAQWADTERSYVTGFHPDTDCKGYFTASSYQANNNCYNYACNIASNSFAHPGRKHDATLRGLSGHLEQEYLIKAAAADGLQLIGDSTMPLPTALQNVASFDLDKGHLVAVFMSVPKLHIHWQGDFHFVRCDAKDGSSWSQKSGQDQPANFDFQGKPLSDPSKGAWEINQGPSKPSGKSAFKSEYKFAAWMFVPSDNVDII
jgi:hypothetical protein